MQLTKPMGYWTFDRCHTEALLYETRSAFNRGSASAYVIARKKGWLDQICIHMKRLVKPNGYWDFEKCRAEALKYDTRTVFSLKSRSAYGSADLNGWLDQICSHMVELQKPDRYWTFERCHAEALRYKTRNAFKLGSHNAYSASRRNKWYTQICKHMPEKTSGYTTASDNNCFYLWRVVGAYFNGLPIYKPGVTSTRLKFQRIKQVAKAGGLEYELILWLPVINAYALETKIKSIGISPQYSGFDGCTEFRAFTHDEKKQIEAMTLDEFVI